LIELVHGAVEDGSERSAVLISLVGLPGSGKTTVGRQLAKRLHIPFVDSDHAIEARLGCSIREFFDQQGENAFRQIEAEIISGLTHGPSIVLSTGGGVVLNPQSRSDLRSAGFVVYLKSSPDELYRRLRHDSSRPLLQVADPLGRLRDLYVQRGSLYRETAHFVLETGRPSVATLVNLIIMQLDLAGVKLPKPDN